MILVGCNGQEKGRRELVYIFSLAKIVRAVNLPVQHYLSAVTTIHSQLARPSSV